MFKSKEELHKYNKIIKVNLYQLILYFSIKYVNRKNNKM